jgi:hypothetical protein
VVNGGNDRQIWYKVSPIDFTNQANGWIVVRYDGKDFITQSDACSSAPAPDALTFPYDRRAAANYAIEHSYDTAVNHGLLQGQGLVTQRLLSQPQLPYAYFRYSGIGQAQFVTGSAAFVSESLWMGGMPMILGNPSSCTSTTSLIDAGWRYCFNHPTATPQPYGDASNPFDTHEDLFTYWTGPNSVGLVNPVLQSGSSGFQLRIQGGQDGLRIIGRRTEANPNDPNEAFTDLNLGQSVPIIQLGAGNVVNPSALSSRVIQLLTSSSANAGRELQVGDYMFINSNPSHGLLVVGWQEALSCPAAIFNNGNPNQGFRLWAIGDFAKDRFSPAPNMTYPVPWVVDFTSPPNAADNSVLPPYVQQTQNPVPRPFYCTMYWDYPLNPPSGYLTGIDKFSAHDWQFFTMPEEVSTDGNAGLNTLYVNANWNWGN